MNTKLNILFTLIGFSLMGCTGQAEKDTTILVLTAKSAPNVTVTMRLVTESDQKNPRQFGNGQVVGLEKVTVAPVIRYLNRARFVDLIIRKEEDEEVHSFEVEPRTQSSHSLPYGISLIIK